MNRFGSLVLAVVISAVAGGCQAMQGAGEPMVRWQKGGEFPWVVLADETGQYALYSEGSSTPKATYYVRKDQPLGFEVYGDDVTAVAGENRVDVPRDVSHFWARR